MPVSILKLVIENIRSGPNKEPKNEYEIEDYDEH